MIARLKTWLAVVGLCTVVLFTTTLIVRTEAVAGMWVRHAAEQIAEDRDWSIRIGGLSPAGLTGIQLTDVRIRGAHGRVGGVVMFDHVTASPDLRALLSGNLTLDHLLFEEGTAVATPNLSGRGSDSPASEQSVGEMPEDRRQRSGAWFSVTAPDRLTVTAKNLDLSAAIRPDQQSSVWHFESLTASAPSLDDWTSVLDVQGFGATPRGTPFSVGTVRHAGTGKPRIQLTPLRPIRGGDLAADQRLRPLHIDRVSVCPACSNEFACLHDMDWAGESFVGRSNRSCVSMTSDRATFHAAPIRLSKRGTRETLRARRIRLDINRHSLSADVTGEITDGFGGTLEFAGFARPDPEQPLVAKIQTNGFDLQLPLNWSGFDEHLRSATVRGELFAGLETRPGRLRVKADAELRNASIAHEFVGPKPLPVDRLRAAWISDYFLNSGVLNVPRMQVGLADSVPVDISGYVANARPGYSFAAELRAHDVSAPKLRRRLPKLLAEPADGTRLQGKFNSRVRVSGHTRSPERLTLSVDIGGGVEVAPIEPDIDLPTLAAAGPPVPDAGARRATDIALSEWVSLTGMPDLIPRAVTAAEDVHFFKHDGFAWRGLRNAMVHNLEVGRLERGGSTITQQVAKNLFLTRRRTLTRKTHEMWLTWRLESRLSKERILELYLNIVEWGPGSVRGLREASRHFFDRSPDKLTTGQVTMLASILPAPAFYGKLIDNGYLPSSRLEKIEHILKNLAYLDVISQTEYERLKARARSGQPGGLNLTLCRDPNPPRRNVPPETPECARVLGS